MARLDRPEITIPPLACDCHANVIGPLALFPLQSERSYTPPEAPLAAYRARLEALGFGRGVLVQPSVFGTDNSCLLQALAKHRNSLRGIAVVHRDVAEDELERMAANGVRGLRVNTMFRGGAGLDELAALARRIARFGWHLELLVDPRRFAMLAPLLPRLEIDLVIGHLGLMPAGAGIASPGFKALSQLVRAGRCWVKLSGAHRISAAGPPYHDTVPMAQALLDLDPTRMVWGSDWPAGPVLDADLLDLLFRWAPDERLRHLLLVENPARLYGFDE